MQTTIVPITKEKKFCILDEDSNKHKSLTNISSKMLEYIIFYCFQCFLSSIDNQFGFKSNDATEARVLVLKKAVTYQRNTFYFCSVFMQMIFHLQISIGFLIMLNFKVLFYHKENTIIFDNTSILVYLICKTITRKQLKTSNYFN